MVKAIGYNEALFNPFDPGRLCRGRERWISPWPSDGEPVEIYRLAMSGASFEDDSARDSIRGIVHSGLSLAHLVNHFFPRRNFVGFMEDGHTADIPEGAEGVEIYVGSRAGGRNRVPLVRWRCQISGVRGLATAFGQTPTIDNLHGLVVLPKTEVDEERLNELIFLLTGISTLDSPPARFQPAALMELLDLVPAVILLHRDKHGAAVGMYTKSDSKLSDKLKSYCSEQGVLVVPFGIPPMLARWDRALFEYRDIWEAEQGEDFPVPKSKTPSAWEMRRVRQQQRKEAAIERARVRAERQAEEEAKMAAEEEAGIQDILSALHVEGSEE